MKIDKRLLAIGAGGHVGRQRLRRQRPRPPPRRPRASRPPGGAAPAPSTEPSAEAAARRLRRRHAARAGSGRGRHPERRGQRRDRPLDVLPVADLRRVHQGHDRPLRGDLSGRQGQLGRPPGHVPGRPGELVQRGQRAGRHQPVRQRGLGLRLRVARPAPGPERQGPAGGPGHLLRRASGTASWSTARTSSSRGTRA